MSKEELQKIRLSAQYAVLSELSEYFPLNSKHTASTKLNKMMDDILSKLDKLKQKTCR